MDKEYQPAPESPEKQQSDSDIIFTAISTGAFENFKEAEQAVVMLYVTDQTFSRAGISHALKRLERHYKKPVNAEKDITDKIKVLKDELSKREGDFLMVDGWRNFCRVFEMPEEFPESHCFGGGVPVNFQMVDWFNPVEGIGQPAIPQDVWIEKFGNLDGMEKEVSMKELNEKVIDFLQRKQYIKRLRKYMIIYDFDRIATFTGNPPPMGNDRFA